MLSKQNRADKNAVERIFKEGRFISSPLFTFKFIKVMGQKSPKISVIAPKSVAKGAVERNTLRRRGYRALRVYIKTLPSSILGALVFKKPITNVLEIENELKNIFSKIN